MPELQLSDAGRFQVGVDLGDTFTDFALIDPRGRHLFVDSDRLAWRAPVHVGSLVHLASDHKIQILRGATRSCPGRSWGYSYLE